MLSASAQGRMLSQTPAVAFANATSSTSYPPSRLARTSAMWSQRPSAVISPGASPLGVRAFDCSYSLPVPMHALADRGARSKLRGLATNSYPTAQTCSVDMHVR
ncbi:uncharacterized protein TRAVEDRAFT_49595 [Trametes versicolor FP-101664 SS1]|uniref:uncharacterized protein n=1 Tax=Trametes versicolor (strain FP-101664) TaxID=717944 RepID=UPI00046240EF|nr:uncharacterized protein TRAVEDRAFT_49595 [Trametes versicolor FP-101664 SS1]EIW56775.1 hypothetical protein TRAVEDRAFT_49595 [Trametes versicolor FP-101664 SS1]